MAGGRRFSQRRLDIWRSLVRAVIRVNAKAKGEKPPRMTNGQIDAIVFQWDFDSYEKTGKSLTGATWVKGRRWPIPCTARGERR